jgi:hypothetical protein
MRKILVVLSVIAVAVAFTGIASAQVKAPETIIIKGNPMGAVKFPHLAHTKMAGVTCQTCHHPSKPQHPAKVAEEACSDCHTKVATPPMTTTFAMAFHAPMYKSGLCVDCHKKEAAAGKPAPTTCTKCHQKANG